MEDMWRYRDKPVPLDFDLIQSDQFVLRGQVIGAVNAPADGVSRPANGDSGVEGHLNGSVTSRNGSSATPTSNASAGKPGHGLKDQRSLSLRENLTLFISRLVSTLPFDVRLCYRFKVRSVSQRGSERAKKLYHLIRMMTIRWISSLPRRIYVLELTVFQARAVGKSKVRDLPDLCLGKFIDILCLEMAGNIIPAIATTNAIISGLIVLQALHLLRAAFGSLRNVHAQFKPSAPLSSIKLSLPNPQCGVCRDAYALLQCDPSRVTLAEVLDGILDGSEREVSTYEDKRMLSDPDFDDNLDRTLESLSVTKGKFLSIADENDEFDTISLAICPLP
jgi:ubiquitin-like 1-activating enzyme E1 B